MKTVRTTFLTNQKNRSVYFDAEEVERCLDKTRGRVTTDVHKALHQEWAILINSAYDTGFQDGLAEALAKAEEG